MILDGAEVISISKKGNFGVIKYTAHSIRPIPIKSLAICQYENDKSIYVFLCNDKIEVEQDNVFNSLEEAKHYAFKRNKHIIWDDGIKYISFDDIDFKGGQVNKICSFDQDMLEVFYPNGYVIDVGYILNIKSFVITTIKNNDWINIVKENEAKSDIELKRKLKEAIQWINTQDSTFLS